MRTYLYYIHLQYIHIIFTAYIVSIVLQNNILHIHTHVEVRSVSHAVSASVWRSIVFDIDDIRFECHFMEIRLLNILGKCVHGYAPISTHKNTHHSNLNNKLCVVRRMFKSCSFAL